PASSRIGAVRDANQVQSRRDAGARDGPLGEVGGELDVGTPVQVEDFDHVHQFNKLVDTKMLSRTERALEPETRRPCERSGSASWAWLSEAPGHSSGGPNTTPGEGSVAGPRTPPPGHVRRTSRETSSSPPIG